MPAENLTRIEAQGRAAIINVDSYQVALDLTTGSETFLSTSTVRFDSSQVGASTFIDAISAKVHSVVLNGENLDVVTVADAARIQLTNLQSSNELVVVAEMHYMNTGEGLHRFVDPVDNEVYLYTQFEVPDSRRVFAVFEQPDLKATFEFSVIAPSYWKLISNSPTPEPEQLGEGKASWNFTPTPRISSYITALIAGPYTEVRSELTSSSGRVIPLGVFCRESLAEYLDADYIFEKTRQGFEFYEAQFGVPYPFEKYDQMFVPEFNAGAMENAGAVTFTESYVFRAKVTDAIKERRVVTILHELAHMWFGDLVTMRWWNDLWLNESFAEYASTLATAEATEWHGAWTTFTALEKSWAYRQDQLPSTHPIVAEINDLEDVQVNFDGITYAKGASVLRQLVAWVGQEQFMAGVSQYFKKHAFGNTELADLLVELEATSGRELRSWSKLWLETAGVNTMRPAISVDESGAITSFEVVQTAIDEQPTIRPHRMAIGFYDLVDDRMVRTHHLELDVDGPSTRVNSLVGMKRPAIILLNDGDLAYTKIRLDEESFAAAVAHLSKFDDSLARALIWGAAWDATRDAETGARAFIKLVLANIATETESTTILTLLRQLLTATNQFVAADVRVETLEDVADALWALTEEAAAGSDAQLQFAKFFCQFARTDDQLAKLFGLLNDTIELDGLAIDQDLRWELIGGLAAAGAYSDAEIDEALAQDNTSNGQRFAAAARASIPSAKAKATAWHLMTKTDELSNVLVNAASLGFVRVLKSKWIEPYVDRYFEQATEIWATKTYKIADYLLVNLYPAVLANQSLADKTKAWLETTDFTDRAALRRIMVENLATTERALRAQARDAQEA